jgi:hypothetical protein
MAAPNIVNVTTITLKSIAVGLSTTAQVGILTNSSGSNKVLKINTIRATNIDGAAAADISVGFNTVGAATTQYIARTIAVPADAALVVVDKTSAIYLEENQQIVAQASAAEDIDMFISYEDIS